MATNVLMPQLGESIAEGTIVRWNKRVGDTVDRDEPLFEISTDKIDAEIPSPAAGVLAEIRVREGETVPIESVVAVIGSAGENVQELASGEPSSSVAPGTLVAPSSAAIPPTREERSPRTSPVVRKLALEHDVDLTAVAGTGAGGRVTKSDVLAYVAGQSASVASAGGRIEPLSVMRRTIAKRMVASRRTAAHVHTVFDVDFQRVSELRAATRERYEQAGVRLTYLAFIAKAVTDALGEMPIVNASLDGDRVVYKPDVNLGVAVALEWGLIVPVVKRAGEKNLLELSQAVADLAARARAKQLKPDEVEGGTFTITNPGAFGSILGLPIINQPQVAILCVGAVEKRPVVVDDAVVARPGAYLTLGFDHRLIDGAVADQFMSKVKRGLEAFDEALL